MKKPLYCLRVLVILVTLCPVLAVSAAPSLTVRINQLEQALEKQKTEMELLRLQVQRLERLLQESERKAKASAQAQPSPSEIYYP